MRQTHGSGDQLKRPEELWSQPDRQAWGDSPGLRLQETRRISSDPGTCSCGQRAGSGPLSTGLFSVSGHCAGVGGKIEWWWSMSTHGLTAVVNPEYPGDGLWPSLATPWASGSRSYAFGREHSVFLKAGFRRLEPRQLFQSSPRCRQLQRALALLISGLRDHEAGDGATRDVGPFPGMWVSLGEHTAASGPSTRRVWGWDNTCPVGLE